MDPGPGDPHPTRARSALGWPPRCSLFIFGPHPSWLGLETLAAILDGPDAPGLVVELLQARHKDGAPLGMVLGHDDEVGHDRLYSEAEYLTHARDKGSFVFDFEILRAYGNW